MAAQRDRAIVSQLSAWFRREARDLPWRRRRTGYSGLVSEAMLQQTQVARVVERYRGFMRRFPSVRALAAASEQEVLAEWQELGYYRRARSLWAAARIVVEEFGGRVPREVGELRRLPGVGRYTAGAVASIVYGRREAVVDGNVQRVLARVEGRDGFHQDPELVAWAWGRGAEGVEAVAEPGVFNDGVRALGAGVCTPRRPKCGECPLASVCVAFREGRQEEIPGVQRMVRRVRVHHHSVVVMRAGKVLLERRGAEGMWARMWQVPTVEGGRALGVARVEKGVAAGVTGLKKIGKFEYGTTHRDITFHVFTARSRQRRGTWRRVDDVGDLPMSNAQKRVLEIGVRG